MGLNLDGTDVPLPHEPGFDSPDRAKPASESSANWHKGTPGPGSSMEDLRWYCTREIGNLQGTARASGKTAYGLRMEFDIPKGRVDTKSEALMVQAGFTKVRTDTRDELAN